MIARRHLIFAGACLAFSACNRSRQKIIAVIPKATSHLFFVSVHAGVEQAARDLHVNVLWNGPTDETDYTRQIEIVVRPVTSAVHKRRLRRQFCLREQCGNCQCR